MLWNAITLGGILILRKGVQIFCLSNSFFFFLHTWALRTTGSLHVGYEVIYCEAFLYVNVVFELLLRECFNGVFMCFNSMEYPWDFSPQVKSKIKMNKIHIFFQIHVFFQMYIQKLKTLEPISYLCLFLAAQFRSITAIFLGTPRHISESNHSDAIYKNGGGGV